MQRKPSSKQKGRWSAKIWLAAPLILLGLSLLPNPNELEEASLQGPVGREIQEIWASHLAQCRQLEEQSQSAATPLRETLSPEEFGERFPLLPQGPGPRQKTINLRTKNLNIPVHITVGTTPENIPRHGNYAQIGLVFPQTLTDGPNYLVFPDTPEARIDLNIGKIGKKTPKISNPPTIKN